MSSSVEKHRKKVGKPAAMKLIVTISEKTYVLGILSFNILKEEFSYHFTYPLDAPVNHFNCDTGEYTARFDHITWHRNNVHIKRRDDVPIERFEIEHGPLFCSKPIITPLYVESLYFVDSRPCLQDVERFEGWKASQTQEILRLEESRGFSIMFVLVPSSTKMADLLLGMQFLELPQGLEYPPCFVDLCNDTHLEALGCVTQRYEDFGDLKSLGSNPVPVRVRLRAVPNRKKVSRKIQLPSFLKGFRSVHLSPLYF